MRDLMELEDIQIIEVSEEIQSSPIYLAKSRPTGSKIASLNGSIESDNKIKDNYSDHDDNIKPVGRISPIKSDGSKASGHNRWNSDRLSEPMILKAPR